VQFRLFPQPLSHTFPWEVSGWFPWQVSGWFPWQVSGWFPWEVSGWFPWEVSGWAGAAGYRAGAVVGREPAAGTPLTRRWRSGHRR
jgi:hypothetical protein